MTTEERLAKVEREPATNKLTLWREARGKGGWAMKRMAYGLVVLALAGLVLAVSGCKEPRESEAEVRKLVEETGSLKAQNRTLEQERNQLESEVSSLKSENDRLKEQLAAESSVVTGLKEEVERLKVGGVAAVKAVEKAFATEAAARQAEVPAEPEVPSADEPPQEGEKSIPEITKAIADLELRKTNLRAQIGAGQTEVSALTRATIDTRMPVLTGCFVDGQNIYRKRLICGHPEVVKSPYRSDVYAHHHTDSCFTSDLIGPAVKEGDFRTQHDKDMAIEAAKAKMLPLFEEVRALDKELDQLQKELAELRKEKPSEAKTPEEAPGTVLKHKETGETIKGTLTKQKINNLTVFKLANGETKLINPDEWETLEAVAPAEAPADEKQKEDGR
jgi:chromosome segregation ATPase